MAFLPTHTLDHDVRLPVGQTVTRIGRAYGADLRIEDHTVSHRHALMINSPVGVVLLDDRSASGTFVNGERVTRRLLEPGDEIRIGRIAFTFAG